MPTGTISMIVQLSQPIVFTMWLPEEKDAIEYNIDDINVRLWFDKKNYSEWPRDDHSLDKNVNIDASRINVTATLNISTEICCYIQTQNQETRNEIRTSTAEEYERLGARCYQAITSRINRILSYLYAAKGQYWVQLLPDDSRNPGQFFLRHRAGISCSGSQPILLNSDRSVNIIANVENEKRFLSRKEWPDTIRFVNGTERAPLIGQLLSNARNFASRGQRRAAVIEAISALEVRINRIAEEWDLTIVRDEIRQRLDGESVRNVIKNAGFRGTLALVLPVLLSEEQLPKEILGNCINAADCRNSLIHAGQRDVNSAQVLVWLNAIEECCSKLDATLVKSTTALES